MIAQPPTYAYGSSINVYAFRDDSGVQEIVVVGHADSDTCRRASALIANALLKKPHRDGDFLVAGSARLVRRENPTETEKLLGKEAVTHYSELRQQAELMDLMMMLNTSTSESKEKDNIHAQLSQLENDPDVKAYKEIVVTKEIVEGLVRDLSEVASQSGLIQVHYVPLSVLTKVEDRIRDAINKKQPTVITFADLLDSPAEGLDVAVLVPAYFLKAAEPLVLKYDDSRLTSDAYSRAAEVNRADYEFAMVGDARNRLAHQRSHQKETNDSIEECKTFTKDQLQQKIVLNETCTVDGCFPSDNPISITRRDYCQQVLPQNLTRWNAMVKNTEELIAEIEKDNAAKEAGKIDSMSLGSLIDSMLRDWDLPVERSQAAFEHWRTTEREPAWQDLHRALRDKHIIPNSINGENFVFNVSHDAGALVVRPIEILDLRRSALVIDPHQGISTVADAWAGRRPTSAPAGASVGSALAHIMAGEDQKIAKTSLVAALSADPKKAVAEVFGGYLALFPSHGSTVSDAHRQAEPYLDAEEYFSGLHGLENPELSADDKKLENLVFSLKTREQLASSFGKAPPEHELANARDAAYLPAVIWKGSERAEHEAWEILKAVADGNVDAELSEAFNVVNAKWGLDARGIVERSLRRARTRDPAFTRTSLSQGAIPSKPSADLDKFQAMFDNGRSAEISEAIYALKAERMLRAQSNLQAAIDLVLAEPPRLADAERDIDQATHNDYGVLVGKVAVAKDQLNSIQKVGGNPTVLSRLDVTAILSGATDLITEQFESSVNPQLLELSTSFDNRAVIARSLYEAGSYEKAIDVMFVTEVPLLLAGKGMNYTPLATNTFGPIDSLKTEREPDGALTIHAMKSGRDIAVAQLRGMDPETSQRVTAAVLKAPIALFGRDFSLAEQFERLPVPLSPQEEVARKVLLDDDVRLAILKAFVYGCAAPKTDIAPQTGRCSSETRRAVDSIAVGAEAHAISVPTLEETVAAARSSMKL
jgi:hypothetical protein